MIVLCTIPKPYLEKNELVKNFKSFFNDTQNYKGIYKAYVLKYSNKLPALLHVLDKNFINYQIVDENRKLSGFNFQDSKQQNFELNPQDVILSANQPKGVLAQILMEPNQTLSDSLTYDITAWSLPLAYGVETFGLKNDLNLKSKPKFEITQKPTISENFYAIKISWGNIASVALLSKLHQADIKVRFCLKPTTFNDVEVNRGDLIITKADNQWTNELYEKLNKLLVEFNDYKLINTGFSAKSSDMGGEYFSLLKKPRILLIGGNGASNVDFGQIWHFLDQRIGYPHVKIDLAYLNRINLSEFTTLIIPNGWYTFSDSQKQSLYDFISNGGQVVAIGGALGLFENNDMFSIKHFAIDEDQDKSETENKARQLTYRFEESDNKERNLISYEVNGAIIKNKVDPTHPLGFGLAEYYFSLKTSSNYYQMLLNADNVVYVPQDYQSFGFVGYHIKNKLQNTFTVATESVGQGKIIYMTDNPVFRGFWENGLVLFSNALFLYTN